MTRPLRLCFDNAVYHVMARGNRKESIFYSDADRKAFLDQMNETFSKYSIVCYAYCLLNNHYHLFIKTRSPNLSSAMHFMNSSYANWLKSKYRLVGVVFQGRYKSVLVEESRYALILSTYIHLNPIRAGLVSCLHQYPWSSYLDYIGVRRPIVQQLDTSLVLGLVANRAETALGHTREMEGRPLPAHETYEDYVATMLGMKNPLEQMHKGIMLGGADFIERIEKRIAALGVCREIPATSAKPACLLKPEDLVEIMLATLGIEKEAIFARRGVQRRNPHFQLLLYLLRKMTPLSLKEIGSFAGLDYAAVHLAVKRFELKLGVDSKAAAMKDKVEKAVKRWAHSGNRL
jgi:putative transposase